MWEQIIDTQFSDAMKVDSLVLWQIKNNELLGNKMNSDLLF